GVSGVVLHSLGAAQTPEDSRGTFCYLPDPKWDRAILCRKDPRQYQIRYFRIPPDPGRADLCGSRYRRGMDLCCAQAAVPAARIEGIGFRPDRPDRVNLLQWLMTPRVTDLRLPSFRQSLLSS